MNDMARSKNLRSYGTSLVDPAEGSTIPSREGDTSARTYKSL